MQGRHRQSAVKGVGVQEGRGLGEQEGRVQAETLSRLVSMYRGL